MKAVIVLGLLVVPGALAAQQVNLAGTWEAKVKSKDGPQRVVIRADSSASWGKETVRWRLTKANEIRIALGGEWESYTIEVKGDRMKLSGENLEEPITLRRVGPPTVRPDSVAIPPDPDAE
jgi:hypothetical protein